MQAKASSCAWQMLGSSNNKAIRAQLWAVYTTEYKRGINSCWMDALATADTASLVISSTFDAVTHNNIASRDASDPALTYQARDAYGRALLALSRTVSTMPKNLSTNRHNSKAILIAMLLIGLCDETSPAENDASSWPAHYQASQRFLKTVGPQAFDTGDRLDMELLQVTWFLNFLSSVSLRRRMILDLKTWDTFSEAMCDGPHKVVFGFLRSWYEMIVPVPGYLQDVDHMLASRRYSDQDLEKMILLLMRFSTSSKIWIATHIQPREIFVNADNLDMHIEEHCFLLIDTRFPVQYYFHRQEMAMLWVVTTFIQLIAECTALRAMESRSDPLSPVSHLDSCDLVEKARSTATSLTKGVFHLSQLPSITYTSVLSTVLEVLENFFAEIRATQGLGWCQACRVATELRLQRLRKVRPRTLCRVGEVTPLLVDAVKFRSKASASSIALDRPELVGSRCPFSASETAVYRINTIHV